MNKIVLIDGNSIANRAFYALPPLSNSAGMQTNAVYGFTTMLLRLLEEEQPTHFLVAFDAGKATFRHQDYKEYKGHRMKTPPELSEQFPLLRELLDGLSISRFELEGYEADDIIGTISRLAESQKWQVLIVTGDKDMLQLASNQVTIALTRKGISEMERYGPAEIQEKYGLAPKQIIDLKGLMGDASDNIPGIPGVGEKTALKLLHEYGSVEEVLTHADSLKGKLKERVTEHAEDARMSKDLATIFREVPVELKLEDMSYGGYDQGAARELFRKLEFKSLLERLGDAGDDAGSPQEVESLQLVRADVEGSEQLESALERVQAVHLEVIGENPHEAEVIGIALDTGDAVYTAAFDWLKQSEQAASLRQWLADAEKPKHIYDSHKAIVALHWHGLSLEGVAVDVLLAGYLLDPTQGDDTLSGLSQRYGTGWLASDEEVFGKGAKFKVPDEAITANHLARKARAVLKLAPVLKEKLEADGMRSLLEDVEMPLTRTLSRMETTGFKVDKAGLVAYGQELTAQLDTIVKDIYAQAGEEFNLNSPKQLGEILFEKLGLPVVKKTKTGYSTDAEVLDKLAPHHEIVSQIVHYRQLAKLQSTYIEGLVKEIREKTGKIHTYYRQTIAATGRLSSQFPNLQNIPIRMEEGRKIRKVFVPSEPGWQVLAADYSQIELRVLAHISGDPRLKEAFIHDMDIHTKTAMDVFGVHADEVDANMRRQAKAVNFGIVYGISDYGLSQNLNITRKEAAQFIEQYFAVFEGVKQFMTDIVKQARKDGYVSTLLHRRRYLPEIKASNFNQRSFAERTAMNTPIQGTAADIIKLAMVQMEEKLREEGLRSRMLLQVHDELVFEVPEEELGIMKQLVPQVMEQAIELDVPLKADVSYGQNWYEAK
ncbi:DNA polymerase I [Xylanibacillus composti]|uniref:DNA polymerase I n=1 Tax=Xylanibacillus composti TaxID=1572762 RepID=A0A8J4M379_9BACL|nr:DNA polymerase I [Xylanibacillus composti]MDT9724817.1 DNA polymerase I [Xylanibacillus composti]GIQ69830.1 DNA polymerase [Xylanibacillus composti]